MPSRRIAPIGAVLLAITMGSAAAQDGTSVGKPLQLLQFTRHDARHQTKAPLQPHARLAEPRAKHAEPKRRLVKETVAKPSKMLAAIHRHRVPEPARQTAEPTPAAAQPAVWPAVDSAALGGIAVPAPPAAPQNVVAEPVVSDAPNAIATDGKVAQADPAPEANALELAAVSHPAATASALDSNTAAAPAVRAMTATPVAADADTKSPIGSAPWLLQVLAALGGALAAGVVAWFLILRRRGEPQYEEFFAEAPAPGE